MLKPATVIHGRRTTSCKSGLEAWNIASTQREITKVMREVISATQRMVFFASELMNRSTSTPSSGKNVRMVRGCRKKFMLSPREVVVKRYAGAERLTCNYFS